MLQFKQIKSYYKNLFNEMDKNINSCSILKNNIFGIGNQKYSVIK